MTKRAYWSSFVDVGECISEEEIKSAIEDLQDVISALQNVRIKSLSEKIDQYIQETLTALLNDAALYEGSEPGTLTLRLDDEGDFVKRLSLMEMASEIAQWRQRDMVDDFNCDAVKEAWALKFEVAAATIRSSKERS